MTLYTQTPAREDLFLPGQGSDLLLKTANGALHVHRLLLRLASPVFSALLEATPKDGRREHVTVSEDTETVVALLAMLYPNMKRTPFPTTSYESNPM
jgi:predicted solute-binding protein